MYQLLMAIKSSSLLLMIIPESLVFLLKLKTVVMLRQFLQMIHTQLNAKVKIIMSDNGSKFVNADYFDLCHSLIASREGSNWLQVWVFKIKYHDYGEVKRYKG